MNTADVSNKVQSRSSLLHRVLHAGKWTMGGHMMNQALRLGSNLILTRLLFPEAFGLMAIVQSVMVGLRMFSDLGIEPAIIQSKRADDADYVNTAWTIQVLQGVAIWLFLCALGPFVARFYAQPLLTYLMPAVGFGAVLGGLSSTKLALANRALQLKSRVLIEVGSFACGLAITIVWAWFDHTVWALVWGGLIGASIRTICSHVMLRGSSNRFAWEASSVKALLGFGQWVFLSSALTFLVGEGNKLLIGGFVGVKQLAFFTLASTMNFVFWQLAQQINSKVLYPAYAEVERENPQRLKAVSAKSRLMLIIPGWFTSLFFVLWGDHFMGFLYDQRYAESGYMLQLLAMGQFVGIIGAAYSELLWAKGMVRATTELLAVQIVVQILSVMVGYYVAGDRGVIAGVAAANWLFYPAQAYFHAKVDLWHPKVDLPFIAASAVVTALMFTRVWGHI